MVFDALVSVNEPHGPTDAAHALELSVVALQMLPADAVDDRAIVHERIARIQRGAHEWEPALQHDSAARAYYEHSGNILGQARTRLHVALDLQGLGREADARVYAQAAAAVFANLGPAGSDGAMMAARVLDDLEHRRSVRYGVER